MKIVIDVGKCNEKMVKEFVVHNSTECNDESSKEFRKVYVRGKCVKFSPTIINKYMGRSQSDVLEKVPSIDKITKAKLDFGEYVFDQTMKQTETYVVKLPIAFPNVITKIVY